MEKREWQPTRDFMLESTVLHCTTGLIQVGRLHTHVSLLSQTMAEHVIAINLAQDQPR